MSKKGVNFFEEHVEKLVLGLVGLICVWLFIVRVVISPNYVEYENRTIGPGKIDNRISEQAGDLEAKLNRRPEPGKPYVSQLNDVQALFESAVRDIDISHYLPIPANISREIRDNRKYRIPTIGEVNDVEVEHIRTVAYIPIEEITEVKTYNDAEHEPNDIDLITVEAKFDIAGLCEKFHESFAGDNIEEEWRDPSLAHPIFAAVELQRQELLEDGSWNDWQSVPRTKIDHRKRMFEVIEEIENLPAGGIEVRLLQFDNSGIRMDLLQPEAYKIASVKEEWFPPLLHRKFTKLQKDMDEQEKRQARAAEKEERERERSERGSRTAKTRTRTGAGGGVGMPPGIGMGGGPFGGGGGGGPFGGGGGGIPSVGARKPLSRRTRRDRKSDRKSDKGRPEKGKEDIKTLSDVYDEFKDILLTSKTDVYDLDEPLTFWAHDDTVELEHSYRYRIRLGVFNPIAGTNQFTKEYKSLKNQAILWSEFSDATEIVDISERLCFFPTDIAKNAETVTIQVFRYALGYWYSMDFKVKQGEEIGKAVAPDIKEDDKDITVPKKIDYSTGAVLVDVIGPVKDWAGKKTLNERYYYDALYSSDGTNIERMAVKSRYWADDTQTRFNELRKLEKEPKEPLREWGSRPGGGTRPGARPPGMPPGIGMPPGMGLPPGMGMGLPPGY